MTLLRSLAVLHTLFYGSVPSPFRAQEIVATDDLRRAVSNCVFCWPSLRLPISSRLAVLRQCDIYMMYMYLLHTHISYIYLCGTLHGIQLHPKSDKSEPDKAQRSQHDFTAINSCSLGTVFFVTSFDVSRSGSIVLVFCRPD